MKVNSTQGPMFRSGRDCEYMLTSAFDFRYYITLCINLSITLFLKTSDKYRYVDYRSKVNSMWTERFYGV